MAEVLLRFPAPVVDRQGHAYIARICGRGLADGRWEGWIEFVPGDGRAVLRTSRETIQPDHSDLVRWATGLSSTYLEGALQRVLPTEPPLAQPQPGNARPVYDGPAPSYPSAAAAGTIPYPHAILDPFSVFAQGEDVLRQQLSALGTDHLRTIVRTHELVGAHEVDLMEMQHPTLVDLIVAAVRKRVG